MANPPTTIESFPSTHRSHASGQNINNAKLQGYWTEWSCDNLPLQHRQRAPAPDLKPLKLPNLTTTSRERTGGARLSGGRRPASDLRSKSTREISSHLQRIVPSISRHSSGKLPLWFWRIQDPTLHSSKSVSPPSVTQPLSLTDDYSSNVSDSKRIKTQRPLKSPRLPPPLRVPTPPGLIPTNIPLYHYLLSPPRGHYSPKLRRSSCQKSWTKQICITSMSRLRMAIWCRLSWSQPSRPWIQPVGPVATATRLPDWDQRRSCKLTLHCAPHSLVLHRCNSIILRHCSHSGPA